ncbi:MAG: GEVED domain-containing protein [Bacteroidota bacterium]
MKREHINNSLRLNLAEKRYSHWNKLSIPMFYAKFNFSKLNTLDYLKVISLIIYFCFINQTKIYAVYCSNTNSSSSNYYINSFSTTGGTANITNNASGFSSNGYGNFTASNVTQVAGSSVNFSITIGNSNSGEVGIWVDWNQDGDFNDANESVYSSSGYVTTTSGTITVPAGATVGGTRMRVVQDDWDPPTACTGTGYSECEDYTFTVTSACTATITLGSNTISASNQCAGTTKVALQSFSLAVTTCAGNLTNIGFTTSGTYAQADISKYQLWYRATTNDISGATQLGSDLSSSGAAGARTFSAFTSPTLSSGTTYYFWITADIASSVTNDHTIAVNAIATGNLTSTSTKAGSSTSASGDQTLKATTAPGSITSNSPQCAGTGITFTKGSCTVGTCYWVSSASGTETTNSANTNTTATTAGSYNVWVRSQNSGCWSTAASASGTINTAPSITGQPSNQSVSAGAGTATFTTTATGAGLTYQWQEYISSWNNISNGGVYSGATSANLVITNPTIAKTGYKYRCTVSGTCTPTATSDGNATLTVTAAYCTPNPSSVDGTGITNITCGTINNTTGAEAGNYGNYNAQSASFSQSSTVTVNITYTTGWSYKTKIWVDWNDDADFSDTGEEVYSGTSTSSSPTTLVATYTVPASATIGSHRMRIGGVESTTGTPTACYTGSFGTYEDYTLTVTAAPPMTYTSCTSAQPTTSSISKCSEDISIIRLDVVTGGGTTSPLSLTEIQFNLTGSTAITSDITEARIYYSGTSNLFDMSTEFTTAAISAAAGTLTATGSQSLSVGTNYFWIAVFLKSSATVTNLVDARITQITVAAVNRTPSTSSPAGTRAIASCSASASPGGVSTNLTFWLKADANDGSSTASKIYTDAGSTACTNAGNVYQWSNTVSGTVNYLRQTNSLYRPKYYSSTANQLINYNPSIYFDGVDKYLVNTGITGDLLFSSTANSLFFAMKYQDPNSTGVWFKWEDASTLGNRIGFESTGSSYDYVRFDIFDDDTEYQNPSSSYPIDDQNRIIAGIHGSSSTSVRIDGTTASSISIPTTSLTLDNSSQELSLGQSSMNPANYYTKLNIGELITYKGDVGNNGALRIESYLAMKYGITLAHSYYSSNNIKIWNMNTNSSYNNNIIGLARDDNSGLMQRQSKSAASTSDIITIYLGTSISANNSSNTSTFTSGDQSFFLIGSNAEDIINTAYPDPETPAGLCCRLKREWLVQQNNFTNTNLRIQIDLTGQTGVLSLNASDLRLIVDADGDFSNASVLSTPTISINGLVATINVDPSNFNSTPYFTLGSTTVTTPLPVVLLNYSVTCKNNEQEIKWNTASETNNSFFKVDFTSDLINYETVGSVTGAGNSNTVQSYSFNDNISRDGYYRLLQFDFDGKSDTLGIIKSAICEDNKREVRIFVGNKNTIEIASNLPFENFNFTFFDMQGKSIPITSKINGSKCSITINDDVSAGIYMLLIDDNTILTAKKIVLFRTP